jgi:DNA-directed RNA polymerase specialized sigma24 family protein
LVLNDILGLKYINKNTRNMAVLNETFKDYKIFYLGLKNGDNKAFHYLLSKIKGVIQARCQEHQLTDQSDDILQQTLAILLKKLEDGSYQFQENTSPATYTISIAANLILNQKRNKHLYSLDIESFTNVLFTKNDWTGLSETVNYYLSLLGEDCQQLIRLRELEGYKYEEIVTHKWMPKYNNAGSLRNKFQSCWEKWMEMIQKLQLQKDE